MDALPANERAQLVERDVAKPVQLVPATLSLVALHMALICF